jgi:hypothetical protein
VRRVPAIRRPVGARVVGRGDVRIETVGAAAEPGQIEVDLLQHPRLEGRLIERRQGDLDPDLLHLLLKDRGGQLDRLEALLPDQIDGP